MSLQDVNTQLLSDVTEARARYVSEVLEARALADLIRAMRRARTLHTLQEVADAAGITRQRVHQLLKKEA